MYINDTYIAFYLLAAIVGLGIGQLVDWMNKRLPEKQKVFSRDIFRKYKMEFKPNYILMIITSLAYIGLVYKFGIQETFIGNLNLIKFLILIPMLLSACAIDYKKQEIPNRLNLTMFEIGLIIAFIFGTSNIAITIDMFLGMLAGIIIFTIVTLIGSLFYGKLTISFSDIKFIATLGLYFGLANITTISIMAFLIGIILGIILLILKKKKDNFILFVPSIVMASFISIFVPFEIIIVAIKTIFTLGMYKK